MDATVAAPPGCGVMIEMWRRSSPAIPPLASGDGVHVGEWITSGGTTHTTSPTLHRDLRVGVGRDAMARPGGRVLVGGRAVDYRRKPPSRVRRCRRRVSLKRRGSQGVADGAMFHLGDDMMWGGSASSTGAKRATAPRRGFEPRLADSESHTGFNRPQTPKYSDLTPYPLS